MQKLRDTMARRRFLTVAAASGMTVGVEKPDASEKSAADFKPLEEGDTIDIGGKGGEIVKNARDLGAAYVKKYSSCSRGSVAALQQAVPFVPRDESLIRAASCLDGGATPTKLASCGAFTGCGMIIGSICGRGGTEETSFSHVLMNELHGKFAEKYGSVLCGTVREAAGKNCADVVGSASAWAAEIILKHFAAG